VSHVYSIKNKGGLGLEFFVQSFVFPVERGGWKYRWIGSAGGGGSSSIFGKARNICRIASQSVSIFFLSPFPGICDYHTIQSGLFPNSGVDGGRASSFILYCSGTLLPGRLGEIKVVAVAMACFIHVIAHVWLD